MKRRPPHKRKNIPEASELCESKKISGTPLNAEQLKVSNTIFNGLFNDLMLQQMDRGVRAFDGVGDIQNTATLLKRIEVGDQLYSLLLRDKGTSDPSKSSHGMIFRDSEITTRDIDLQKIDGEGNGREYWSYGLGVDGVVRRRDSGDITAKNQKKRGLGIETRAMPESVTSEDIGQSALAQLNDFKNFRRSLEADLFSSRREEDMGLNNQPVSPEEMLKLQNFLLSATYLDNPY